MIQQDTDSLLDRIEELEAQLAAMTADRELYRNHLSQAEAQVERLLDLTTRIDARAETYRAAIPRAYAMGVEAAAVASDEVASNYSVMKKDGSTYEPMRVQSAAKSMVRLASQDIRALTPPADLVERVLKTKEPHQ